MGGLPVLLTDQDVPMGSSGSDDHESWTVRLRMTTTAIDICAVLDLETF